MMVLKTLGIIGVSVVFFILPAGVWANNINVDISNNQEGSQNSVYIASSQSNSNITTDVNINTNGEVKSFHTTGNQNINWQSADGNSSVKINNNTNGSTSVSQTRDVNINNDVNIKVNATSSPKEIINVTGKPKISTQPINFVSFIRQEIDNLNKIVGDFFKKIFL